MIELIKEHIKDYNILLKSMNVRNNLDEIPQEISVGANISFLDKESKENILTVPVEINMIGIKGREKVDKNKLNKECLFKMKFVYIVELTINKEYMELEEKDCYIEDYCRFLLEPTINECVSSIGNRIGIPGLSVPRVSCNEHNN